MARVSGFVVLVCLLFLIESERSSGLPTRLKPNGFEDTDEGLSEKERENIRQILLLAAKELQDKDVIQVLKKSLILRLKICFSPPLPSPPALVKNVPAGVYGDKRDEGVTPEQKNKLREVLKEALERIDEEEILDFLKASLYFRLKFCLHTPFIHGPYPGPGPSPEPSQEPTITPNPPPTTPEEPMSTPPPTTPRKPIPSRSSASPRAPLTTAATGENTGPETEEKTENDSPDLQEEALEDALMSISRRNEIPSLHFPQNELAVDDSQVPIEGHDPAEQQAKLEGLEKLIEPREESLVDLTELSESILDGKESTAIEESDERNDGVIDTASDGVENAAVQAETKSAEILTANSNEGEFDSVIRIDYNALQDNKKEKIETRTGGEDLGPIIEPNELLSL